MAPVDAYGEFTFYVPADMLKFGKDFQETELLIDGKQSFLFVWWEIDSKNRLYYNVDLYVSDLPKSQVLMRMWTRSTLKDVELSKAIFRTIKFA